MKRALIFGVGGFVGNHLTNELQNHGYEVYGSDAVNRHPDSVSFTVADLLDAKAVAELINTINPDAIINLAAIASVGLSWELPQKTIEVNVVGAVNIMEAVRACEPMPKVLFIGSSEEYAESDKPIHEAMSLDANNPYGISKMMQEKFVDSYRKRFGLKVYCVRSFNHTGIGQSAEFVIPSWCRQVAEISKSGKPGTIIVGNLAVRRDFGNVKDVVRAYRLVLESDDCNIVYNIGTGQSVLLKDILDYIISFSKQSVTVRVDSRLIRHTDNPVICCDHSRITENLGWAPNYTVFDTINEMMEDIYRSIHSES